MIYPCKDCGHGMRAGETCERCHPLPDTQKPAWKIGPPSKPHRRGPGIFDPARATFVKVTLCVERGVWRHHFACPSSSAPTMHTMTCDSDGQRAECSCKGYEFGATCPHVRAAAEICRVTAYDTFAAMDLAALHETDRAMVRLFGQGGLQGNIRYSVLGDALQAAYRRQDVAATVARGKAALDDLFGESA